MGSTKIAWLCLAAVAAMAPAAVAAQWKTPWNYAGADGPAHWAKLDPAYRACGGRQQSPIDIKKTAIGSATAAALPALRFEYKSGPLAIINNGFTAVRVNYAPGNGNFLVVGSTRYELTQLHFHHPSEEYRDGRPYAMGLHLMHRASDGRIAAVAVMLVAGRANPAVAQLWQHMPPAPDREHTIAGAIFNPAALLPRDTAYDTYMGSLTAPPCTEGVAWYVLKTPVEVSGAQIAAFAKLYPHDVRPVQPLNGRAVRQGR